jgi:hypothetical protein
VLMTRTRSFWQMHPVTVSMIPAGARRDTTLTTIIGTNAAA